MDCDRNMCYRNDSCETCEINKQENDRLAGKCIYPMEREVNQVLWFSIFTGKHEYGRDGNNFENNVFMIKSYDWTDDGNNEFHFLHKPSGFKVQWYKYPLRSPMANMELSHEDFLAVLRDCYNSLNEFRQYNIQNKWWKRKSRNK